MSDQNQNQEVPQQESVPQQKQPVMDEEDSLLLASAELEAQTVATTIDFEGLKPDSVIVVKIPPQNPRYHAMMHSAIVRGVLQPRVELLKGKRIGVLFMTTEDSLEVLTEEDMNRAGWVKKEPSRIIIP